jgi:hypothetical protein
MLSHYQPLLPDDQIRSHQQLYSAIMVIWDFMGSHQAWGVWVVCLLHIQPSAASSWEGEQKEELTGAVASVNGQISAWRTQSRQYEVRLYVFL